MKMDISFI